jgi:hypothetical protein
MTLTLELELAAPNLTAGNVTLKRVTDFVCAHPDGVTPVEITVGLDMPVNSVRVYLRHLDTQGVISRIRRGLYGPPGAGGPIPVVGGGAAAPGLSPGAASSPFTAIELVVVERVTEGVLEVQGQAEAEWYCGTRDRYMTQTRFTETTDLQDLDRMLFLELMIHRWTRWLASGRDYAGRTIPEEDYKKSLREYNEQLIKIKDSMGLSRRARDAAANSGDVAGMWASLKTRAKEFGIHREKQVGLALVLFNEWSAHVGAFDRSDIEEREKLGFPDEHSLLEWVRAVMIPRFCEIDREWVQSTQKYWTAS